MDTDMVIRSGVDGVKPDMIRVHRTFTSGSPGCRDMTLGGGRCAAPDYAAADLHERTQRGSRRAIYYMT